jgi:hypothetical protein
MFLFSLRGVVLLIICILLFAFIDGLFMGAK